MSATLPTYYKAKLGGYVIINMDSDTPYIQFDEHKKQYPPGKWKKHKNWN